nr:prepilin-type N-terminal cleavage/methylation domain-containing protein [Thiorhodovibrio winogradskyi]
MPRANLRGFTLVELLIALFMLSIITLLLFSGLRLGSRAWEGVETFSERVADIRLARVFIERSLRQTRDLSVQLDARKWTIFAGETDRLEWVAPLSARASVPGLYILRLTLQDNESGGKRLMLTRWLLHPDVLNGSGDVPAWEPLLEGFGPDSGVDGRDRDLAGGAYGQTLMVPDVGRFKLAYFGVAEGEQSPAWFDQWTDAEGLPMRVQLDLTADDQAWPIALVTLPGATEIPEPL